MDAEVGAADSAEGGTLPEADDVWDTHRPGAAVILGAAATHRGQHNADGDHAQRSHHDEYRTVELICHPPIKAPPMPALPASATSAGIETEPFEVIMAPRQREPDFERE